MRKKYKFSGSQKTLPNGSIVRRIRRFPDGAYGGWLESEANLSHSGDCWVGGNAVVWGNALVCGNAKIRDNAQVYGKACVFGDAEVVGNDEVYDETRISGAHDDDADALAYQRLALQSLLPHQESLVSQKDESKDIVEELLCMDDFGLNHLSKGKKYIRLEEKDELYLIENDAGNREWVFKERFGGIISEVNNE